MDLPQAGSQAGYPNHQQVFRFYLPPLPPLGFPPLGIPLAPPATPIPSFSVSPCYQNFSPMESRSLSSGSVQKQPSTSGEKTCVVCFRGAPNVARDGVKHVCNRCRAFFRRFVRKERQGGGTLPCLTTRRKVILPLNGDEKVVCNLMLFRDSCQPCRFISCVGAGLEVSNVTLTGSSADSSLNASSTFFKSCSWEDEVVSKLKDTSFTENYIDGEFGGKKIILLRKDPPSLPPPFKSKPTKKTKMKKCPLHRHNVSTAEHNNRRWNKIMGPFLKNQPTVEDQLLAKLSRGNLANRAKLVSPVGEEPVGGKVVILGRRGEDVFNLKPHTQLPSIKVENIRRQENEMLAEKMISAKSLLITEKKEDKKMANQKNMEEVARDVGTDRYDILKKVVDQNAFQREIDSAIAEKEKRRVGEKPQFTLTPLLPLGEILLCEDENNMEMRPVNPREVEPTAREEAPTAQETTTNDDLSPASALSCGDSGEFHQPSGNSDILNLEREAGNSNFLDELLVGADDASLALGLQSSQSDVSFLCSLAENIQDPDIFDTFANNQDDEQSLESIINADERPANFNGIEI